MLRLLTAIFGLLFVLPAAGATLTWTGAASTDWHNTNNWSPAGLPGSGDTVVLASGTIHFSSPVTFSGQFTWSGGTLGGAPFTIATNGAMSITGNNDKSLWTGLTNRGTVTWSNAGDLGVDYSSAHNRYGYIENLAGALWDVQNNEILQSGFSNGAYFRNAGTFRKSAGTGTTTVNFAFFNHGALTVDAGTVVFSRGAVIEGSLSAAAGTFLSFNSGSFSYSVPPVVTGPGTVRLNGGSITFLDTVPANLQLLSGTVALGPGFQGGTITNLTVLGGTLLGDNSVSGTLTNAATLPGSLEVLPGGMVTWSGGTAQGPVRVASNAVLNITGNSTKFLRNSLTNSGTIMWSGTGNLQVDYSTADSYFGFIENLSGSVWDIQNNQGVLNNYNNGAYFRNAGTLRKSAGTGTATILIPFFNSGLVSALTGTLAFTSDSFLGGTLDAASGAAISFNAGNVSYGTPPPSVMGDGTVRVSGASITLEAAGIPNLQLASGSVRLAPNFQGGTVTNLTMLGGTLDGDYTISGIFNFAGTSLGSLTVLPGGLMNWSGGVMLGPVSIQTNATLIIAGTTTRFIRNALTNAGTVAWIGTGNLSVDYSSHEGYYGVIENLPGAVWDLQNNQNILSAFNNGAYFRNAGLLVKSAGVANSTITIPFFNSGEVSALTGTILLNRGATIEGHFQTAPSATIAFNSGAFTYTSVPVITGGGVTRISGGTLTLLQDAIPNLQLVNGTFTLAPGFQGGSISNLTMIGGTLLGNNVVRGTLNWGGTLRGNLTVLSGAVANWNDGGVFGTISIASNAVLNITGDTLKYVFQPFTNAGTVTFSGAADLRVDHSSNITNYGTIYNLPGALWEIRNNQSILNAFPTGAVFYNAGTIRKSEGTGTSGIFIPLINSGSVTSVVGILNINKGAQIEGSFGANFGSSINFNAGNFYYNVPPVVSGDGAVQFTGGTLTLNQSNIPNLRLTGGTLSLSPNFQGGAITNLTMFGGTLTGNNTVGGAFDFSATLQGGLTLLQGATVNWSGGAIYGPVNISENGTLNISGNTTKLLLNAMTNAGLVTWSGTGDLEANYSTALNLYGLIENLPSGVFEIKNDRTLRNLHTFVAYFRNAGLVVKSGGTASSVISLPFTNSGTVLALQRTVSFEGGFSASTGKMIAGLTSPVNYGRFNISGNALLGSEFEAVWGDGFVGSISNTFTALTYGSRTGAFSPVTLPGGADWQLNYGPTALTLYVAGIRRLGFVSPNITNVVAGATLPPVQVRVFDAATGSPVATNGLPVNVVLATGSGTLTGTTTRNTDSTGLATFNDLKLDLAGIKTLAAFASGVTQTTNAPFNVLAGSAHRLGLVASIGPSQLNQRVFTPAPVVQVQDVFGNVVSNFAATVTAHAAGGPGVLGGSTVLNAQGPGSSAAFTNILYTLSNPQSPENIVVFFTSPGLVSVTNPPVLVNYILESLVLNSGNSVLRLSAADGKGVYSWKVDGVEQLHEQWFWLRRGPAGSQVSIEALGPPEGVSVSGNIAVIRYRTNGVTAELSLDLSGGPPGSHSAELNQSLSVQNTSNAISAITVFHYADFDLAGQSLNDVAGFPATDTIVQQGKLRTMTQTATPAPGFREASHFAITLEKILDPAPATLSNQILPPSPGDQTFAAQWNFSVAPGQAAVISLRQQIQPSAFASPPAEPTLIPLAIDKLDEGVLVYWPVEEATGFYLEESVTPEEASKWAAVTNSVRFSDGFYSVTLPAGEEARFFRLKR